MEKLIDIYTSRITDINLSNSARNIVPECYTQHAGTQIIAFESSFKESSCNETNSNNILECIERNLFTQCQYTSLWQQNVTICNFVQNFLERCSSLKFFEVV